MYSCEHVLIRLVEDWRKALDKGLIVGTVLTDLSKAFDAMPHDLLLAKLSAYGWSSEAVKFLHSYLLDRKQRVKIDDKFSPWLNIIKGVPQGSIIGPIAFNIFMNDFFMLLRKQIFITMLMIILFLMFISQKMYLKTHFKMK